MIDPQLDPHLLAIGNPEMVDDPDRAARGIVIGVALGSPIWLAGWLAAWWFW